ncbi:hypothetical protein SCYAM73S_06833 [Streptomyces cyaneofuscatus]
MGRVGQGSFEGPRGRSGSVRGELRRAIPSWMHPAAENLSDAPEGAGRHAGRAQRRGAGASDSSSFIAARKRRTVVSSASLKRALARSVASASGMK